MVAPYCPQQPIPAPASWLPPHIPAFLTSLPLPQVSWALGTLSASEARTQLPAEQQGPPTGCPGRLLELKGMACLGSGWWGGQAQGSPLTCRPPQETSVCCVG